MEGLNLLNLAKGALVERADIEIQKILENIADPNTDVKKARKLTITMSFKPMERDATSIEIVTKSSVVPYNAVTTQAYFGRDESGCMVAEEYVKGQIKGQLQIDAEPGETTGEAPNQRKILNINR